MSFLSISPPTKACFSSSPTYFHMQDFVADLRRSVRAQCRLQDLLYRACPDGTVQQLLLAFLECILQNVAWNATPSSVQLLDQSCITVWFDVSGGCQQLFKGPWTHVKWQTVVIDEVLCIKRRDLRDLRRLSLAPYSTYIVCSLSG
jgi:hypothetical protein